MIPSRYRGIKRTQKEINEVLVKIKAEIEGYKSTIDNAISEDELKIEGIDELEKYCKENIQYGIVQDFVMKAGEGNDNKEKDI